ncbi:hypothetical protein B595_0696 [Chlamydia psittaci 84/55]|nr:hypothetical protein B595_0696 [Chlamydia psittaci 84/55]
MPFFIERLRLSMSNLRGLFDAIVRFRMLSKVSGMGIFLDE